ncbi:MAG: O-antigen ligase family protein [Acidobacteria bacterium]|nr:O-antigen ligase family protein [Acidobacteriota bacterium]
MNLGRAFSAGLLILLVGLMFFDKPFAYLGIGQVFITEFVLLLGVAAALIDVRKEGRFSWRRISPFQTAALATFLVYEAVRTAMDIPQYRLLALRDGVVWGYALFAVIIVTVAGKGTLQRWVSGYRRLAPIFVIWAPIAVLLYALRPGGLMVPGRPISLFLFKPGDLLVHLAGAGAALALWPRTTPLKGAHDVSGWLMSLLWGAGFVMAASLSRGGLLACLAGLTVVTVLGPWKQVVKLAAGMLVAFILLGISGIQINCPSIAQGALNKEISARQAVWQLRSITLELPRTIRSKNHLAAQHVQTRPSKVLRTRRKPSAKPIRTTATRVRHGSRSRAVQAPATHVRRARPPRTPSPTKTLRLGTMSWRLRWWRKIVGYTIDGPYALRGKGFGINLADSDGFQPEKNHGLRDPHNVFMTFLARSGVPGLLLFVILVGTVLWNLLPTWWRSDGDDRRLAVWLLAYLAAMLVNASFDVYIENPMGGVWFWSLVGAAMLLTADRRGRRKGTETAA